MQQRQRLCVRSCPAIFQYILNHKAHYINLLPVKVRQVRADEQNFRRIVRRKCISTCCLSDVKLSAPPCGTSCHHMTSPLDNTIHFHSLAIGSLFVPVNIFLSQWRWPAHRLSFWRCCPGVLSSGERRGNRKFNRRWPVSETSIRRWRPVAWPRGQKRCTNVQQKLQQHIKKRSN